MLFLYLSPRTLRSARRFKNIFNYFETLLLENQCFNNLVQIISILMLK